MIDPYKMIVINLLAAILVSICSLIYKYVYPKKKINLFYLLIAISFLPIMSIFRSGAYESGDFNIHIYRLMDFYRSLTEGILMPTWAGNLNATYGYPLFIFNYSFPYYALSFVHFLGFGYILSMKIILALTFILSGTFMFLFVKEYLKNEKAAFVSAIFYLFAPYHLVDQHFKVAIGEIFIFTLLPLVFLLENKLFKKGNILYISLSSIFIAFLIMSHAVLAFFSIFLIFGYILILSIKGKQYKKGFINLLSIILGVLISSYAWLSPFMLKQYTYIQNHPLQTVAFPSFSDLLYSPWRFGFLFQGPKGQIAEIIGYTQIFILIFAIFLILGRKISKKYISDLSFWVSSAGIAIFFISHVSNPIWYLLPFITGAGGQRLLILLVFIISIISGYVTIYLKNKNKLIYFLVFITIAYTILNWGQRRVIPQVTDRTLATNLPTSTAIGEGHFYAATLWTNPNKLWFKSIPKEHLEILNGKGKVRDLLRYSTYHTYVVKATTSVETRENTVYFPNWKVINNGNPIASTIDNKGLITFNLPKGSNKVEIKFNDIVSVYILKLISGFGILITLTICLLSFLKKFLQKK